MQQIDLSHDDLLTISCVIRELVIILMDDQLDEDRAFLCHSAFYLCKDKLLSVLDPEKDKRIIDFYNDYGLSKYRNVLRLRKLKDKDNGPLTIEEWQEQVEDIPSQYTKVISNGILSMGKAVECALNLRDTAVLAELKKLCDDIFAQAEQALTEQVNKQHAH